MLEDVFLIKLDGVDGRDAAHAMRDFRLYVREEDRPQLLEDEFFVREMIGMDVVMADVSGAQSFPRFAPVVYGILQPGSRGDCDGTPWQGVSKIRPC